MNNYRITVQEILEKTIFVVAATEEQAIDLAYEKYYRAEVVLNTDNFVDVNIFMSGVDEDVTDDMLFVYIYKVSKTDEYYKTGLFSGDKEQYNEFLIHTTYEDIKDFGAVPQEVVMFHNGKLELLPRDVAYKYAPDYVLVNEQLWSNL